MKLKPDCIRDMLMFIEEQDLDTTVTFQMLKDNLSDYSEEDIIYTALKLNEAGFINASVKYIRTYPEMLVVTDMTYYGHQFLEDIRDNENWKRVKAIGKKVGSTSINALMQIASSVITEAIKASFL